VDGRLRGHDVVVMEKQVGRVFDFKYEDFSPEGYDPWPHIKAAVAD